MIERVNIAEREQWVEMRANNEKNNLEDKVLLTGVFRKLEL